MSSKVGKTNAMRQLDRQRISYDVITYDCQTFIDGQFAAEKAGIPVERCYKTLITEGKSGQHYCFCVRCNSGLDLKSCARAVGEKAVSMVQVKDLTALTGYVRGGCSPLGLKRPLQTVIDSHACEFDWITVSGGKLGLSVKLNPLELAKATNAKFDDICIQV